MNIIESDNRQNRISELENEDLSISIHERSHNAPAERIVKAKTAATTTKAIRIIAVSKAVIPLSSLSTFIDLLLIMFTPFFLDLFDDERAKIISFPGFFPPFLTISEGESYPLSLIFVRVF